MLQSESDRVRLYLSTNFVHETFVRKSILQPQGRTERAGKERSRDRTHDHSLASDGSCAGTTISNATGQVRGDGVAAVAQLRFWFCGGARFDGFGLVSDQHSGDHVARIGVARPAAARGFPLSAVPRDDSAIAIDAGTLLDYASRTVVLPGHFILA